MKIMLRLGMTKSINTILMLKILPIHLEYLTLNKYILIEFTKPNLSLKHIFICAVSLF